MDYNPLEAIAKKYDQAIRVARRIDGEFFYHNQPRGNLTSVWFVVIVEAKHLYSLSTRS